MDEYQVDEYKLAENGNTQVKYTNVIITDSAITLKQQTTINALWFKASIILCDVYKYGHQNETSDCQYKFSISSLILKEMNRMLCGMIYYTHCDYRTFTSPWRAAKLRTKTASMGTNTQYCYLPTTKGKTYL